MVSVNFNSLCKEVGPYYYDFLCQQGSELVPEFAKDHIKQCKYCQGQLDELASVLSITEGRIESEQGQVDSAVTAMLKLHFAYIGKPVSCETIKPFLPGLLDPALAIEIPTPITVHLDHCCKCSEDLETIRGFNLNGKQLRRLSQLFADKPVENNVCCIEAQTAVPSVVSIVVNEIDSDILKHLCACPDCRGMLYQRREMVLKGLLKTSSVENKFPCKKISARDFFDYVVPYGVDADNGQYVEFHESLTSHLRTCTACMSKMQELHKHIYGICERAESDVVIIYHLDESAKAKADSESDDLYAGFPIKVDIIRHEEVQTASASKPIDFNKTLRQKTLVANLKPLIKFGAVAAAVVLIAAVLFHSTPDAKAVGLERIYEAVEKIKNVRISSFTPSRAEPIQQQWISRTLNIYLTKTGEQFVLWNLTNKTKQIRRISADKIETSVLTGDIAAVIEQKMTGLLDIVPFHSISNIPRDADWIYVPDTNLENVTGDIEIYDLTWTEQIDHGSRVFRKWRVFTDAGTNLPQRIEWYDKLAADNEYTLNTITTIEYLSGNEIQKIIEEVF